MLLKHEGFIIGPRLAQEFVMSLTINHRTSGTVEILTIAGDLTLGDGTSSLRQHIRTANERQRDVLVDLCGVPYIDSAGLGELVASFTSVTNRGRAMKLLRPAKRIRSLLHVTKLYSKFEIFEDESSALASFGKV